MIAEIVTYSLLIIVSGLLIIMFLLTLVWIVCIIKMFILTLKMIFLIIQAVLHDIWLWVVDKEKSTFYKMKHEDDNAQGE